MFKLEQPPKLRASRTNDVCEKCEEESAGGIASPSSAPWVHKVVKAIEAVHAERPAKGRPDKASLWDLFDLERYNGSRGRRSDRGEVLSALDTKTLCNLRDWLDGNAERGAKLYDRRRWQELRATVGIGAWVRQLPRDTKLSPEKDDGLPIQIVAVRSDGKKWDLNLPIRVALLQLVRRYYSQQESAELLGIGRGFYRKLFERMAQEGFKLDRFTFDVLERIVRGKKRGPKPEP